MAWSSSLLPRCIVIVLLVSQALTADPGWRVRQRRHVPQRLEDFGLLEKVALLDSQLDLESQLWSRLLGPMLVSRYVGTEQHEHVRQHIVNTMSALGWTVDGNRTFEMKTPRGKMPFTNVVATHDPEAPRRLVLACHYDSIYGRDKFVAATDSAVPCAMMLYLATLMTKQFLDPIKGRSELTVQLMFLDGEEAIVRWTDTDSIYGARHLASEMAQAVYQRRGPATLTQLDRIDVFVLLDLLGAARPAISNYPYCSNVDFKQLMSVEKRLMKKGLLGNVPRIFKYKKSWSSPLGIEDDHLPFMHRGVKILHVIPVPFPSVWHEDSDDASVVHRPTITSLSRTLHVWTAEYLRLAEHITTPDLDDLSTVHEEL